MPDLTEEQNGVLEGLVEFKKEIQTLGGYAGTGKTTLISHLRNNKKCKDFAICAFTGKAANILRRKGLGSASTIHSLIYVPEKDDKGHVHWVLRPNLDYDGIIVDESSMVGRDLHRDLSSYGLPIIYVGDHGQLEPVGEGINLMEQPDFVLETIHRNAGEIAFFAEHIRKGHPAISWTSQGKVQFIDKTNAYEHFLEADQIICAFNKTRVGVNRLTRQMLNRADAMWPEVGDKVMCLRNNREKRLFNGMQGIVESMNVGKPKNKMRFITDETPFEIVFDTTQFNKEKYDFSGDRDHPDPFDFAYCITAHKSQGDEFPVVMVLEQKCKLWDHKRWAYTAASRAREKVLWVTNY